MTTQQTETKTVTAMERIAEMRSLLHDIRTTTHPATRAQSFAWHNAAFFLPRALAFHEAADSPAKRRASGRALHLSLLLVEWAQGVMKRPDDFIIGEGADTLEATLCRFEEGAGDLPASEARLQALISSTLNREAYRESRMADDRRERLSRWLSDSVYYGPQLYPEFVIVDGMPPLRLPSEEGGES